MSVETHSSQPSETQDLVTTVPTGIPSAQTVEMNSNTKVVDIEDQVVVVVIPTFNVGTEIEYVEEGKSTEWWKMEGRGMYA